MIVYLESNFVLELAFLQAEHDECSALLRLAETEGIQLVGGPTNWFDADVPTAELFIFSNNHHGRPEVCG